MRHGIVSATLLFSAAVLLSCQSARDADARLEGRSWAAQKAQACPSEKACAKRSKDKQKDATKLCKQVKHSTQYEYCLSAADAEYERDLIGCSRDGCLFDEACCDDAACVSIISNENCGGCGLACRSGSTCEVDPLGGMNCSCLPDEEYCAASGSCYAACTDGRVFDPSGCACVSPVLWKDDFDSGALSEGWSVWESSLPRLYGFESPAGHYSIESGQLRWAADPMITTWSDENRYVDGTVFSGGLDYNLAMNISRSWSGETWTLEFAANHHAEMGTNSCGLSLGLYFGDGPTRVSMGTYRNEPYYAFSAGVGDDTYTETLENAPNDRLFSVRIARRGSWLTVSRSVDGSAWTKLSEADLGSTIDGLDQRLYLTGIAWFNPQSCFATYEYFRATSP